MIQVGRPEVVCEFQREEWRARVAALLVHSNRYGWVTRLGGWTGPVERDFSSREAAVDYVEAWVAEAPDRRCAFIAQ